MTTFFMCPPVSARVAGLSSVVRADTGVCPYAWVSTFLNCAKRLSTFLNRAKRFSTRIPEGMGL